jgi:glycine cleavage system P protein (glycine dehydrogenase) subunit 1
MPFNPHTEADVTTMLEAIGASDIRALFDEIPASLMIDELSMVPERISEMEISRLMHAHAARDGTMLNFIGAGAYEHHIPAAVWEITTRGEFYSAYTPYQAEASQGTLQLIYEFQTMMTGLTGLDVSNASLYDGASALAEAVLMAVRSQRKDTSRRILVMGAVNPLYQRVMETIAGPQQIRFDEVPCDPATGQVDPNTLAAHAADGFTAVVIQHPNFFGGLEAVDAITDWAHEQGALVIASSNPVSLALLKPPGEWGTQGENRGADIACGEGQPLGVPLSSGGPYFGYMTCKQALVRQMPGRIVGRTVDLEGREGFTLTLQAREQHIRRSKATSNICTNQGLMVTAATIHMALLGQEGLRRVAAASHANTMDLIAALTAISGVDRVFGGPVFHEAVLLLDRPVEPVLEALATQGIVGGYALNDHYPELGEALLICATETRTAEDIDRYAAALDRILSC